MAFKDILLTLTSYPDPTPASVAEDAVAIAATFGAHLAAVACEVHVQVPGHFLSGSVANVPGLIAGETEKSRKSAKDMLAAFNAAADKAGILHEKARKVRVVTVTNEKKLDRKHFAEELAKNLARHGIDVVLDKVDASGRRIGEVLESYAASHQIDVLVMGAYGTARWREFILGGATKSLLSKPPLPILFSH